MNPPETGDRPAVRIAAASLLAAFALLHLWLSAQAGPGGFLSDDSLYLLMAEWLAGNRDSVVAYVATHSHLPPGYPVALALSGASGDRPLPGHLLNATLFGALMVVTWWHHRRRQPAVLAVACSLLLAIAPGSILQSLTLWSEPLYTLLSVGCIALLDSDRPGTRRWLAVALLAGIALSVRSAAVALLLAVAVQALRQRPPRAWIYGLTMLAPITAWWLLRPRGSLSGGYGGLLERALVSDGGPGMAAVFAGNARTLAASWAGLFDWMHSDVALAATAAVAVITLAAWLTRLLARKPDAVYVFAYLAMMLLWPATQDVQQRLLLPLLPLALGYACDGGLWLARAVPTTTRSLRTLVSGLPLALVGVAMLPSLTFAYGRLQEPMPSALEALRYSPWWLREPVRGRALDDVRMRAAAVHAARELRLRVAVDDCIYAFPPQFYMLHSRRRAFSPPPPGRHDWPRCEYAFAPGSLENVVLMDGVATGSTLIYRATLPDDDSHIVGLLFKLPPQPTDNAADAND